MGRVNGAPDPIRRLLDERVPWAVHGPVFSHQSLGAGPLLAQGWKLHVSATPFSAADVLGAAIDPLLAEGARFKVVNSVERLTGLNAGHLGSSQIGKFLTVYPSDDAQAVRLAASLADATAGLRGPRVPTDRPLRPGSLVHYRYGAIHGVPETALVEEEAVGRYELLDPAGRLTDDLRLPYYLPPAGVADPFERAGVYVPRPPRALPLNGRYLVIDGLAQSARGGVFRAIDSGVSPARFCLLKEAWHDVSLDVHGRDARDWLVNEERILVRHAGSPVLPRFYDSFDLDGNRYMAIEFIEGTTLASALLEQHGLTEPMSVSELVAVGRDTAAALAELHERRLVFRDFSPANVIAVPGGRYRLIDFGSTYDLSEGSLPIGGATPPFYSPEQYAGRRPAPADDVFGWGAVLHYLCCGPASVDEMLSADPVEPFPRRPVAEWRRDVPPAIAAVIDRAVSWEPEARFADMRAAADAFALAVSASGTPAAPPSVREAAEGSASERRPPSRAELLRLACAVGDALCDEAEERNGGLCWAARDELTTNVDFGPDLYSGAAGVGLYLAELARVSGDRRYEDAARGAARWLAGPAWGRGRAQHGLHCGEAGVSLFFLALADLLGEPGYVNAADIRMRRLEGTPFATLDVTHGAAGTVLGLVALFQATGESRHLAAARAAGDELTRAALRDGRARAGCYWDVPPAAPGGAAGTYLGLLHGAAGIGLALAHLAVAAGDDGYLSVARDAAELLLAEAHETDEGLAWDRQLGDDDPGLQAHCHGAGGICQFFLALDRIAPDPRCRDAALGAARTVAAQRAAESRSCACHGLAGVGHLMLDCHQSFGDAEWLDYAFDCAAMLERFREPGRAGVYTSGNSGVVSPDLMLGYAGVGSYLIRLADPAFPPDIVLGRLSRGGLDGRQGVPEASGKTEHGSRVPGAV